MLWWLSQLTYSQHFGASTQIHDSYCCTYWHFRGSLELAEESAHAQGLWQAGAEPQSSHLYTKHELQSPQTRHFNDCGSSAQYP